MKVLFLLSAFSLLRADKFDLAIPFILTDTIYHRIDTVPMPPELVFFYENLPQAEKNTSYSQPFYLNKAVHYLTDLPETAIPTSLDSLPGFLNDNGYRIFRIRKAQIHAIRFLLRNGLPLLLEMERIRHLPKSSGEYTLRTSSQPFFNVLTGFAPVEPAVAVSLDQGDFKPSFVLYLRDNTAIPVRNLDPLESGIRDMLLIADHHQKIIGNQSCRVREAYLIVPAAFDRERMNGMFKAMLDSLSFDYQAPFIEQLPLKK